MDHPPLSDLLHEDLNGLTSDPAFLAGGGEMGALIRAIDLSQSPLGPIERWPAILTSTLGICLSARFITQPGSYR